MDWELAISRNTETLKRIVAALVAMAGLSSAALTSPLRGGRCEASGGGCSLAAAPDPANVPAPSGTTEAPALLRGGGDCGGTTPTRPSGDGRPPLKGEVEERPTIPRHLHTAVLRLLRPAEAAVRRLIIVAAREISVPPSPPQAPRPRPKTPFVRDGKGTGIVLLRRLPGSGYIVPVRRGVRVGPKKPPPRSIALPLLDPLKPLFRRRRRISREEPRISWLDVPRFPIPVRHPPRPNDPLDATRIALRLAALTSALDDLPKQAHRFARWRANCDARRAQDRAAIESGSTTYRFRRTRPLRPGPAPGLPRQMRRRDHELHQVLDDLHGLAFEALRRPDTS